MTTELWLLVACTLATLIFPYIYNVAYARQIGGGKRLAGNRENLPPRKGMALRGYRAHQNHLENLVPFAILILIATIIGTTNTLTLFGA